MAITNLQQELSTSKQISDPAKPHNQTLEDIKDFHEDLESERIQHVLQRWRKRKRDEELRNGTALLEKVLRALHDGLEDRKERAELWNQALIAEIKPDKARHGIESRAATSTLSLETQTQFAHAIASHLNIKLSREEMGRMLSKTTAAPASAAKSLKSSPPTPPAEQRGLATPPAKRSLHSEDHARESEARRLATAPRTPGLLSRSASQAGSRDDYAVYLQGARPQGPGHVSPRPQVSRSKHLANTLVKDQITITDRDA